MKKKSAREEVGFVLERSKKGLLFMAMFLFFGGVLTWGGVIFALNISDVPSSFLASAQGWLPEINDRLLQHQEPPQPTQLPRSLDGKFVEPGQENPWLIAVMIENLASTSVRPQSGLASMPVVYETLAEGGITRFLGLFMGNEAAEIGPVRSARPYYVELAQEYDAMYDHAGGSPQALTDIIQYGIHDFNALGNGARFHWRDHSKSAPHNLYTSSEKLSLALRDFEFADKHPEFTPWKFKDEKPLEQRPEGAHFLRAHFSSPSYQAHFEYNRETNSYNRFHGDTEQSDKNTGEQITVKNIIVQRVPSENSGGEKGRILIDIEGEGDMVVFRDGEAVVGNWKKEGRNGRTQWFDSESKEIELNRGHSWVIILPGDRELEYE